MEGPSNGGMLYHEVQESKLCAVHCINTLLQGPFFSEIDLAALASDLDQTEQQMMSAGGGLLGDFLMEDSHNVSLGGNFSIQVLEKALGVWDLHAIPFNSPVAEASKLNPELETAFICHLHNHWFCVRKVNGEWYNFNSLFVAPEHLSKFYLSAFLDTLRGLGWSIFLVRGNFPKDCPILSSNAFGQWITPDDAQRIMKSCNEMQARPQRQEPIHAAYSDQFMSEADALATLEELDLNTAIAASLMDSSAFTAGTSSLPDKGALPGSPAVGSDSVAVTASLLGSAFCQGTGPIQEPANLVSHAAVGSQSQPNSSESSNCDPQADSNAPGGSTETIPLDLSEVHKPEPSQDNKDQ